MKISKNEMILGVVVLAGGLGWVTLNLVEKQMTEWKSMATEMEKMEQQMRLDKRRINMQEEWIAELKELQKNLRAFDINQRTVAPELMKTIKIISNKHGLEITRSQPRNEKPTGDLYELGINCTWQGELKSVINFLADLQRQGVNYDVRTLNIKPVEEKTGKLGGNMVIHCAYTKKPIPSETEKQ
ncbi:MAG TPA: type 4a pilus biogenesis protein PilO [Pontiella sp.]